MSNDIFFFFFFVFCYSFPFSVWVDERRFPCSLAQVYKWNEFGWVRLLGWSGISSSNIHRLWLTTMKLLETKKPENVWKRISSTINHCRLSGIPAPQRSMLTTVVTDLLNRLLFFFFTGSDVKRTSSRWKDRGADFNTRYLNCLIYYKLRRDYSLFQFVQFLSVCLCFLSLCLSVCLYPSFCLSLSICLSVCLFIPLSICLSLSLRLSVCLYPSICLSVFIPLSSCGTFFAGLLLSFSLHYLCLFLSPRSPISFHSNLLIPIILVPIQHLFLFLCSTAQWTF